MCGGRKSWTGNRDLDHHGPKEGFGQVERGCQAWRHGPLPTAWFEGPARVTTRGGGSKPCREDSATGQSGLRRTGRAGSRTGTPKARNHRCSSAIRTGRRNASPQRTRQTHRHQNRIMQHSWVDVWVQRRNGRCWFPQASGPGSQSCPESSGPHLSKTLKEPTPARAARRTAKQSPPAGLPGGGGL